MNRQNRSALASVSVVLLACASAWVVTGCSGRPERAHAAAPDVVDVSSESELQPGTLVPDVPFTLQDGFQLHLPGMKGKLIAAFFCAAQTDPECQREATGLADRYVELREHHIVIVGVSPATTAIHKANLAAQHSPLDFASDSDGKVARAFGTTDLRRELRMFVVNRDGTIRAVWHGADPDVHTRALLAAAGE